MDYTVSLREQMISKHLLKMPVDDSVMEKK